MAFNTADFKVPSIMQQFMPVSLQFPQTTNHFRLKGDLNTISEHNERPALLRSMRSPLALRLLVGRASSAITRARFSRRENECQPHYCAGLKKTRQSQYLTLSPLFCFCLAQEQQRLIHTHQAESHAAVGGGTAEQQPQQQQDCCDPGHRL